MNIFKKTVDLLGNMNRSVVEAPQANSDKPRFESVLKQRNLTCLNLKNQKPGISQTQEALAKEWRKSNSLKVV